ncbi:hypothetical protein RD792_012004 [Penstemon davidsonii]|uniref:PABC domain-containing protein n=1 Tax=Penstemon davidsonii TaxID=160366 RepID=A0ABR0CW29_9LAMI|nr:hypothetical protein RD792_012004 [Penstemon davidsonii]
MNGHVIPQAGGPAYALHLQQQQAHSVASSKDSSNQQQGSSREMNRGSAAFRPLLIASRPGGAEGSEMLSSLLAAAPPKKQKQILGERIFPLVSELNVSINLSSWQIYPQIQLSLLLICTIITFQPELAAKITGMLLEMDNAELLLLLDSAESLAAKVDEAVEVLKLSKPKVSNQDSLHSKFLAAEVAVN